MGDPVAPQPAAVFYPKGGISESIALKWVLRFGRWPDYYPPPQGLPEHMQRAVAEGREAVDRGADPVDWVNAWAAELTGMAETLDRVGRMAEAAQRRGAWRG